MKIRKFCSYTQGAVFPGEVDIIYDVKGAEGPHKGAGVGNMHRRSWRTVAGGNLKGVLRDDPEIPGAEAGKTFQAGATWRSLGMSECMACSGSHRGCRAAWSVAGRMRPGDHETRGVRQKGPGARP